MANINALSEKRYNEIGTADDYATGDTDTGITPEERKKFYKMGDAKARQAIIDANRKKRIKQRKKLEAQQKLKAMAAKRNKPVEGM